MLISRSLPGVPAVDVVLRDGTNTLTADWDVGAHKIENVVDPAAPQDVATKNYADGRVITPLAPYATTTAIVASPQPIAWMNWVPSLQNYVGHMVTINATMASTDAAETATFMLYNLDTSTYVEIGGPGITVLSVTGTSPSEQVSVHLNDGASPVVGFNPTISARYELQIYTSNAAFPAILGNASLIRL